MAEPISFSDSTIARIADAKLQAAIEEGQFDNLPGLGKPLPLIDEPYDPGWWVRRKLKREELAMRLTPD
ncbi:hypothetical protein KOR34_40550 [Posidoniimonas corsicana]|uniref:DnaJ homologue subfamily C member 28 conserved domain-containing protein n=1 Tax=Posidoniimonas corsicana TaxID=1938618 RepID=A0A5C5V2X4_9BACT|nr:DUF1992 domain-containing protein [Posidoniimonas corsicana]TWT32293.1 hypothetical protein KOR34_40550 [Posidoniimonas corsicana]